MRSTLVYDLPTRLFHWLFAGLFLLSFLVAKNIDDESLLFSYHMLSGLVLGGLVIWRIVWGFIGSTHARFSGFNLSPVDLRDYFLGILSGSKKRWSGHNPASSWAALIMLFLALALSISGYLMSSGNKETFEDLHELMANTFMIVVASHIAGILLHLIRHKDGIALSMLDGKKEVSDSSPALSSVRPFAAVTLIILVISACAYLFNNFDSQSRTLTVFGRTLQLGDNETQEQEH